MYVQRDPNRYLFRRAPNRSRPVVVLILLALLIPALFVLQDIQTKRANNEVVSPFEATATLADAGLLRTGSSSPV